MRLSQIIDFILKWVYAKKIKDFEFNRGGKTAAAPLGCKVLTTKRKFKRSIFKNKILIIKTMQKKFKSV